MLDGALTTGFAALVTVTVAAVLPVLPRVSVTEKVTIVSPIGSVVGALFVIVAPGLSKAL